MSTTSKSDWAPNFDQNIRPVPRPESINKSIYSHVIGLKIKARLNFEKVQVKRLTCRKFNLREVNVTCLEVPEGNKIGNCASKFRPADSIPSSDHLQSKNFCVEKVQVKRLT